MCLLIYDFMYLPNPPPLVFFSSFRRRRLLLASERHRLPLTSNAAIVACLGHRNCLELNELRRERRRVSEVIERDKG
jgi:hypothetical protein